MYASGMGESETSTGMTRVLKEEVRGTVGDNQRPWHPYCTLLGENIRTKRKV